MANALKAGDIVVLKSGGPNMTIEWTEEFEGVVTVSCSWFDTKMQPQNRSFPADALKPVE